jgi:AMMECR1 domain-containing protein
MGVVPLLTILLVLFAGIATAWAATPRFTRAESSALVEYARACLLARLDGVPLPPPPPCATRQQQACFVTFFRDRRVVACFGGFTPRRTSLAEEIADNVRLALTNDPRSRGLSRETAQETGVQITFPLDQPERVADYRAIDPLREGMFVEGNGTGVAFVPGEARTASWAFRQALARLGESDPSSVRLYRFRAVAISTRNSDRGNELPTRPTG